MEPISSIHVASTYLWSAGDFTLNCYESKNKQIVDKYYYTCEEKITNMIVLQYVEDFYPLLSCQDSSMRLISPLGKVHYTEKFSAQVTAMT
jgi:hypothetical protein